MGLDGISNDSNAVGPMDIMKPFYARMFAHPRGGLGRLGGHIMARVDAECGVRACELLEIAADDAILEIGFGPGVTIEHLAGLVPAGHVAGIDQSLEMVVQARARNAAAISAGRVDLQYASVGCLPYSDSCFDGALAINPAHAWDDPVACLLEIRRVLRAGATLVLGFTPNSGQTQDGAAELLQAAGYEEVRVVEIEAGFCVLGTRP